MCNETLQDYLNPESPIEIAPGIFPHRNPIGDLNLRISLHTDCILKILPETIKSNMNSAGVLLGLMPVLLSNLGPKLDESSVLMLERPVLVLLLLLGGPAISVGRPFQSQGPFGPEQTLPKLSLWSSSWPQKTYTIILLLEYLLALAAIANTTVTSLELGLKTVLTWKKANSFLPLIWMLVPVAVHIFVALLLRYHRGASKLRRSQFTKLLKNEMSLCLFHKRYAHSPPEPATLFQKFQVILFGFAEVLGIIHSIMGTLVFSSLLFVSVVDAVYIFARYAASALVVKLVILAELSGLQSAPMDSAKSLKKAVKPLDQPAHKAGESSLLEKDTPVPPTEATSSS